MVQQLKAFGVLFKVIYRISVFNDTTIQETLSLIVRS